MGKCCEDRRWLYDGYVNANLRSPMLTGHPCATTPKYPCRDKSVINGEYLSYVEKLLQDQIDDLNKRIDDLPIYGDENCASLNQLKEIFVMKSGDVMTGDLTSTGFIVHDGTDEEVLAADGSLKIFMTNEEVVNMCNEIFGTNIK